jgi:hypothetical protein
MLLNATFIKTNLINFFKFIIINVGNVFSIVFLWHIISVLDVSRCPNVGFNVHKVNPKTYHPLKHGRFQGLCFRPMPPWSMCPPSMPIYPYMICNIKASSCMAFCTFTLLSCIFRLTWICHCHLHYHIPTICFHLGFQ